MYPFICSTSHSLIHFTCVLISAKPPAGGKAVLCAGDPEAIKTRFLCLSLSYCKSLFS